MGGGVGRPVNSVRPAADAQVFSLIASPGVPGDGYRSEQQIQHGPEALPGVLAAEANRPAFRSSAEHQGWGKRLPSLPEAVGSPACSASGNPRSSSHMVSRAIFKTLYRRKKSAFVQNHDDPYPSLSRTTDRGPNILPSPFISSGVRSTTAVRAWSRIGRGIWWVETSK